MKKLHGGLVVAALLMAVLVMGGCDSPVSSSGGGTPSGPRTFASASEAIAAIPERNLVLPTSLGGTGAVSGSSTMGIMDTGAPEPVVIGSDQPGLRGNGFNMVQEIVSQGSDAEMLVNFLKHVAARIDLPFDQNIPVGIMDAPDGEGFPNGEDEADLGIVRVERVSASEVVVFWVVKFDLGDEQSLTYRIRLNVKQTSAGTSSKVLMVKRFNDDDWYVESYSEYDAESDEGFTVWMSDDQEETGRQLVRKQGDTVTIAEEFGGDGWGQFMVAWANDSYGGVIGQTAGTGANWASIEIYDHEGFMVKNAWGQADLEGQLSWLSDDDGRFVDNTWNFYGVDSLPAPPETIVAIHNYSGAEPTTTIMADEVSLGDTGFTHNHWRVIWRNSESWDSGDIVYYGSWEWDAELSETRITYTPGYVVPAKQSLLDDEYYFWNRFPLRYVELAPEYANFTLQREKLGTHTWDFTECDDDGNCVTIPVDSPYYDWWLELQSDEDEKIRLSNLQQDIYFMWNSTDQRNEQASVSVVVSTGPNLAYFDLKPAAVHAIDRVESQIQTVATELKTRLQALTLPSIPDAFSEKFLPLD